MRIGDEVYFSFYAHDSRIYKGKIYSIHKHLVQIHDIERGRLFETPASLVFYCLKYPNTLLFKKLYEHNIIKELDNHLCVLKGCSADYFRRHYSGKI